MNVECQPDRFVCLFKRQICLGADERLLWHLFAGYGDVIPEQSPQDAGVARRSRQRPVVAVILVQTCRQQRSDVETRNLHFLICRWM